MTWNAFHRRGETLRTVVSLADARVDGRLPLDAPGVPENFHDEVDLVGALLLKWHARLSASVERALAREPLDLSGAVAAAWRDTAEAMPGLRAIFDRYAESGDPEMQRLLARAREREWARLALAAGIVSAPGRHAVEAGRELEQAARAGLAPVVRRTRARTPVETVTVPATPEPPVATGAPAAPVAPDTVEPSAANARLVARIKEIIAA